MAYYRRRHTCRQIHIQQALPLLDGPLGIYCDALFAHIPTACRGESCLALDFGLVIGLATLGLALCLRLLAV